MGERVFERLEPPNCHSVAGLRLSFSQKNQSRVNVSVLENAVIKDNNLLNLGSFKDKSPEILGESLG
jgi:hypothetical protein